MPGKIDLTPFGFTPTESILYEVLLTGGPGTGYTIARTAGLARANVYAALEGLVGKGAARVDEGRPRQFRPEPPGTLLARLSDAQGEAMDQLSTALAEFAVPSTPTLVELTSPRGAVQLMGHEIARAEKSVELVAPPDGCLALAPHLRRAASTGVSLDVASTAVVPLGTIPVAVIPPSDWPGHPVLLVVDGRAALLGSREGDQFSGHWGSGSAFVAAGGACGRGTPGGTMTHAGLDPDDAVAALKRDYLRDAPERLAELRKDLAAFRAGEPDALESLRARFHRLAGSGGSYGFPHVTEVSRAMEHRILTPPIPTPQEADHFEQAIQDLKAAFDEAATDLDMPMVFGRLPGFAWRALLSMPPSPVRNGIVEALEKIGFVVAVHDSEVDPWDVSPSDRPDLVVIGTDGPYDALALARYWAAATPERPRAVVLADPGDRFDRLRTAAAGLDAVFGSAALPVELSHYARALARIGAPPASVVVVEDDPAQAQLIATWLGQLNARVSLCSSAQSASDTLSRETPDIVLLDVDLPDVDGYAVARLMRQDARLALVPVVFLTARHTLADEMEGLRAGGDDFLEKPVERSHLLQVVLTRTERGRRIRELVHRDGLTGVLNHATLMAELEHAIAFAERHGEPLCFLMLDLDHFKRINDTYGHLMGDQVLMHVATVFRRTIRASDLLGRYGGEEFGIILRRCPPANGRVIAEKLRASLAETPMKGVSGELLGTRVSIGVATFLGSGKTATEVAAEADRALYQAKAGGRDRVEMA